MNQYIKLDLDTSVILVLFVFIFVICFILFKIIVKYHYKKNNIYHNKNNTLTNITNDSYKVIQIDNLLTPSECDELISYANTQQYMKSEIVSSTGDVYTNNRVSQQIWIKDTSHKIANKITNYIEKYSGYPRENMEELQFVKYDVSGYFNEHYDPDVSYKNETNDRIYTLIIYLNDDFEGGHTYFKNINLFIKPKKGMAVLFKSLSENNDLLTNSLHTGTPITKGNKYICNKWIHLNKFN